MMDGEMSERPEDSANMDLPSTPKVGHVSNSPTNLQRGSAMEGPPLLLCMSSTVVKGFGRGSKLLGIPTANMDTTEIAHLVNNMATGIYFGYCMLKGEVYQTVASVGWNPHFDNREKTLEPHLLHTFEDDFYGERVHLLLCGYIRRERSFDSIEHLIAAIEGDIEYARMKFREPDIARLATEHPFWLEVSGDERAARTPSASTNAADASGSAASAAPSDKA